MHLRATARFTAYSLIKPISSNTSDSFARRWGDSVSPRAFSSTPASASAAFACSLVKLKQFTRLFSKVFLRFKNAHFTV